VGGKKEKGDVDAALFDTVKKSIYRDGNHEMDK